MGKGCLMVRPGCYIMKKQAVICRKYRMLYNLREEEDSIMGRTGCYI
jgi:hypothetical protein